MKITWIGHSCFKLVQNGYSVITDPYEPGNVPGLKDVSETANLVLCSHEHGDHNYREGVTICEASAGKAPAITEIASWHDEVKGAKRGHNIIRRLDFDGFSVVHLGDIGCELEPAQKEVLMGADVLFVPAGGFYTIYGKEAAELVGELKPKLAVLMHFRDDQAGFGYKEIFGIQEFLDAWEKEVMTAGSCVDTDALGLSERETRVLVMTPQNIK